MVKDIIEEIKKGLTGDPEKDIRYLQEQGMKYRSAPEASEILKILSDMSFDLLPEDNKKQLKTMMFIGNKRLDQVYNDVNTCVKNKDIDGAISLLAEIEKRADQYFAPDSTPNNFSFRNRLDEYIYANLYKPENKYIRTPFDFCQYFSAYGYLLVEKGKPQEAIEKLEKAIAYNPANVEPRFELAEVYKLTKQPEKLLECTRETLKISTTPVHIARCYTNLGYYAIEIKDYDSAVAFYYESVVYQNNPAVSGELQHIRAVTGKDITPPTREDILAAFEKYGVKNGPDQDVVNIAYSLGSYCIEHDAPPQESMFYMQVVYGLTRDEKVKEKIDMLNAQIAAKNLAQESKNKS